MCTYSGEEEAGLYEVGLYMSKLICPMPKDI